MSVPLPTIILLMLKLKQNKKKNEVPQMNSLRVFSFW